MVLPIIGIMFGYCLACCVGPLLGMATRAGDFIRARAVGDMVFVDVVEWNGQSNIEKR